MALKIMTVDEWRKTLTRLPADKLVNFVGISPGGASQILGITRQGVHQAIQRDRLDAVRVERDGNLVSINISLDSIEHYRRTYLKKAS